MVLMFVMGVYYIIYIYIYIERERERTAVHVLCIHNTENAFVSINKVHGLVK